MFYRNTFLASALILAGTGFAAAQTIFLPPEQEVVVREYVVQNPSEAVVIPDGYSVVVGDPLPDTITVTPLDAPGFQQQFEYVVIDGQTVLIDPSTRKIVHVLK